MADVPETALVHATLKDEAAELAFRLLQLLTGDHAVGFLQSQFDPFLPTRLHGEVGLREGDLRLAGVAVLGDEVAGVTRKGEIVDGTLRATA